MNNNQITKEVKKYMQQKGVAKTFLAKKLDMTPGTFYARLKNSTWKRLEIKQLHNMNIIFAPTCNECGEIADVVNDKLICTSCDTTVSID